MERLKKLFFSLIFIFFAIVVEMRAQTSTPVSATGYVIAEIIPVFSASESSQMNFGRFSPGPQGGQIVLSPGSMVSVLGSVFTGTGTHNAASFNITGDADATYSITLPSSPVILSHTSSAKTMFVKDWLSVPSSGIGTGKLLNGFQVVYVGATLNVGTLNDNPVGIYTGSYIITFDFN